MESKEFSDFKEMLNRNVKFSICPYKETKVVKAERRSDDAFTTLKYTNRELFSRNKFRVEIANLTRTLMPYVSCEDFFDMLNTILKSAEKNSIPVVERTCYKPKSSRAKGR